MRSENRAKDDQSRQIIKQSISKKIVTDKEKIYYIYKKDQKVFKVMKVIDFQQKELKDDLQFLESLNWSKVFIS